VDTATSLYACETETLHMVRPRDLVQAMVSRDRHCAAIAVADPLCRRHHRLDQPGDVSISHRLRGARHLAFGVAYFRYHHN